MIDDYKYEYLYKPLYMIVYIKDDVMGYLISFVFLR